MKVVVSMDVMVDIDLVGGAVPIMTVGSDMVIRSIGLFRPMMPSATFQNATDQEKAMVSVMRTTNDGGGVAK